MKLTRNQGVLKSMTTKTGAMMAINYKTGYYYLTNERFGAYIKRLINYYIFHDPTQSIKKIINQIKIKLNEDLEFYYEKTRRNEKQSFHISLLLVLALITFIPMVICAILTDINIFYLLLLSIISYFFLMRKLFTTIWAEKKISIINNGIACLDRYLRIHGCELEKEKVSIPEVSIKSEELILAPLLNVLRLAEENQLIEPLNTNLTLYRWYSRYKMSFPIQKFDIEVKEFFQILTTIILSRRAEGHKKEGYKNDLAIFELKSTQSELYSLVYNVMQEDRALSLYSCKTELSKGFNRKEYMTDLKKIEKTYSITIFSKLANKHRMLIVN